MPYRPIVCNPSPSGLMAFFIIKVVPLSLMRLASSNKALIPRSRVMVPVEKYPKLGDTI